MSVGEGMNAGTLLCAVGGVGGAFGSCVELGVLVGVPLAVSVGIGVAVGAPLHAVAGAGGAAGSCEGAVGVGCCGAVASIHEGSGVPDVFVGVVRNLASAGAYRGYTVPCGSVGGGAECVVAVGAFAYVSSGCIGVVDWPVCR